MTDFSSLVTDYLRTRRAMGYKLAEDGRLLRQFAAYLEAADAVDRPGILGDRFGW